MNRLTKVIIFEIIEAAIFLTLIIALRNMAEILPLLNNFVIMVIFIWVVSGIATPIILYEELQKALDDLFRRLKWFK